MGFRCALGLVLAFTVGCSSKGASANGSIDSSATGATSAERAAPLVTGTPDEMLQARLQRAVRDLPATRAMRGPQGLIEPPMEEPTREPLPSPKPQLRMGQATVSGRLPPEVIRRIARQNLGSIRVCYETLLRDKAAAGGTATITYTIDKSGDTKALKVEEDFGDKTFAGCVERAFAKLTYPAPEGGVVKVSYPITFAPSEEALPPPSPSDRPPPRLPGEPNDRAPNARPVDAVGPWPIVTLEGGAVKLDGQVVVQTAKLEALGRLQKIEELFEALKRRREDWTTRHLGSDAPGVAGLRLSATTNTIVAKSVFQTMAYSGFPNLLLQSAESPATIVEIAAQIPSGGLAGPIEPPVGPFEPAMHVDLGADWSLVAWKDRDTLLFEERVERDGDLSKAVCDAWAKHGVHREAADARRDRLVLHAQASATLETVMTAAQKVLTCTRPHQPAAGAATKVPAFWLQFSIR